jgi:hypothetical protein
MMIFPVGIGSPNVMTVQRPHDANPGEHRRPAKVGNEKQPFHSGLPFRGVVFGLGQSGDVEGGIL